VSFKFVTFNHAIIYTASTELRHLMVASFFGRIFVEKYHCILLVTLKLSVLWYDALWCWLNSACLKLLNSTKELQLLLCMSLIRPYSKLVMYKMYASKDHGRL